MDYRVMMVEKDRLMLQKLSGVIERTPGFTMAVRYQNASDALGQGKMFNPNLILLDIPETRSKRCCRKRSSALIR